MSVRDIVGGLAEAAVSAAKNPLKTTAQAVGVAKGVATTGAAAAEGLAQHAADRMRHRQATPVRQSEPAQSPEASSESEPEPDDKPRPAAKKTAKKTAKKAPGKRHQAPDDGPQVVLREPAPPAEPPIDVVGEALAAEAQEEQYGGRAGEPRGASRDEEHGDASLQRAEVDEIADETAEGLPGGDVDVETPVGTTGAGVGYNPDTAEADLQQPDTPPLVDPALTKEVKSTERRGKRDSTKNPKS
ncbi:MAG TPA: hypothetical protein VFG72_00180 [Marmoricola sp.]|nr:hypothetical protein [Marmoricola sp.]